MKNKTIRSSAREIIYHVYLHEARKKPRNVENAYHKTAEITGKSVTTIKRIAQEGKRNNGTFTTPGRRRKGRPKKDLSDFDMCCIRQKIQIYYAIRKQTPNLRSLQVILKEDLGFIASREHLRQVIKSIGFRYLKYKCDRSALIEKTHLAAKRADYLQKIMSNRNLPEKLQKDVVYVGESFVEECYKLKKTWYSVNSSYEKNNETKTKRYIIFHAGTERGFIPGALLIYKGANKNPDFRSDVTRTIFMEWLTENLIPNLPESSIVVMDSSPYHLKTINKWPTLGTYMADIKHWLTKNQISFDDTLRKPQLLMLVKRHRPQPVYEVDEMLGRHGHTVMRLPHFHSDLNPIEIIWNIVKERIAVDQIAEYDIKEAALRAFKKITATNWKEACERVVEIEKGYYEREQNMYENIEQIVVDIEDDDISSTEDSCPSSDDMEEPTEEEYLEVDFIS